MIGFTRWNPARDWAEQNNIFSNRLAILRANSVDPDFHGQEIVLFALLSNVRNRAEFLHKNKERSVENFQALPNERDGLGLEREEHPLWSLSLVFSSNCFGRSVFASRILVISFHAETSRIVKYFQAHQRILSVLHWIEFHQ